MAAPKSEINLLPKSEFDLSFWGRVLKWGLTTGRYIIIVTELIVILAFLSRFKLDKDLVDLNERLAGKKAILDATYHTETVFRGVQSRLLDAQDILDHEKDTSALLDHVADKIPQGLVLDNLSASWKDRHLTLSGKAGSQQALAEFMYRMRKDNVWKSADLISVASGPEQSIIFSAEANF